MNYLMKSIFSVLFIFSASPIAALQTSNVEIIKLTDKYYKLVCTNGGDIVNTFASVGDDGILLVDGGFAQTATELKSKIESLGNGELKMLINTHAHPDHIGANSLLAKNDITIIAHANVRNRLAGYYGIISNVPDESLPNITFENSLTLHFNDEEINLLYFPGHSDGDVVVHFPESNIVIMGDLLLTNGFPSVEVVVGGNIEQYIESFAAIIDQFPANTRFFPGHGEEYTHAEMKEYYQMIIETTDAIRKGLKAGKNIAEMRAEKILEQWQLQVVPGAATANYWIGAVAGSLANPNPGPSIAEPLLNTLIQRDVNAAIMQYKELKKNSYGDYEFHENTLNALGYFLLGRDRSKDAIEIFKLNVAEYPEASNVYDSLGEAYMVNGDKEPAIINYEKSLKLDPDNQNAVARLKILHAK
ncbi:MBL fold metallo-hydrolase [Candidatus Neomarinimicrobiota bacterium]